MGTRRNSSYPEAAVSPPDDQPAYADALARVMSLADFERASHSPGHSSFHLERMSLLMERLGRPHLATPTVHVAGTKGKGSTAAMATAILEAAGYRVGLYTSPHLHSVVERIRVGLEPVTKRDFSRLADRVWPIVEEVGRQGGYGPVTTFEMLTAMAFAHFELVGADFQVIEVGLGGRLDSTNVVKPDVCAITSISLDHVSTLGDTVSKIAREKAGIIKDGIPVVVSPQPEEALSVIRRTADERNAPLVQVGDEVTWRGGEAEADAQPVRITGLRDRYEARLPLLGGYQLENAATAVGSVEVLANAGASISKAHVELGLSAVRWPARLEVISREGPVVVVDGAHNPFSVGRLAQAVRTHFNFRSAVLIFGVLDGHGVEGMAAELRALECAVIAVRSRHPRSLPSRTVAEAAADHGLDVVDCLEDTGKAARRALEMAGPGDLILGTGSLSVAAEVIEEMRGIAPEIYPRIKGPRGVGASTNV